MWPAWFVIGACVGSFLNVCIYRLPREQSIIRPRSRCQRCQHPIAWYDNLPLLSLVLLRGRCRHCHTPIRWHYPVVELLTAFLTVVVFDRFGVGAKGFIYAVFVYALIIVSFIDLEFQIIPDEISLGGLVAALLISVWLPGMHGTDSRWLALQRSVVGLVVGGGLLYATGLMGNVIFRKESMGGGDVKLLAMAGALLGWKLVALTFFLAPLLALIPGLCVLALKRSHVIPYGPFLSLALVVSLVFGGELLRASGVEELLAALSDYYRWQH
ncbi:MAG: prepilin peptidase [Candidatus Omnitrophota bacterium]|nr:prepilin peptidase [Candidatus Omnitrophota bacterium]